MFGKMTGSVTIRVEAIVFGTAPVFLNLLFRWSYAKVLTTSGFKVVLEPSSARPTCQTTAETIAPVLNQECVGMAVHQHIYQEMA